MLVETAADGMAQGVFAGESLEALADVLWATVHGLVVLELAGYFPSRREGAIRFSHTGLAVLRGFMAS